MNNSVEIKSPCINICKLNPQDICGGCGRTLTEIGAWRNLSAAQKQAVIELAGRRRDGLRGSK